MDGSYSAFMEIECGVPQGSVLGPLLYVLFTNDLPEAIHDDHEELSYDEPHLQCDPCGGLVNYVDDGTCTITHKDPEILSTKLSEKYKAIEEYMVSNRLVIDGDKTHLLVMGSRSMDRARQEVSLRAGQHIIYPSKTEKLLGCNIDQSLKWLTHVQTSEKSLIKNLTSRINGLQMISKSSTFKTRLSAANGVFMSALVYILPLWGGCEDYLLKTLQVIQNRAARQVTRLTWYTPVRRLLTQCNWLSIKQLIFFHSALLVYRTFKSGVPLYLAQQLRTDHPLNTRLSSQGAIRIIGHYGAIVESSFLRRAARSYNTLPVDIRSAGTVYVFKKKLKIWIKNNIPVR